MIQLIANTRMEFDLVKEALTNHGFEFTTKVRKKFILFGHDYYEVNIAFCPSVHFLEQLLREAERIEDYYGAASIQRMINIKLGK